MSRPYKKTVTVEGMRKSRGAALERSRAQARDRPRGQGTKFSVRAAAYQAALGAQETKYFDTCIEHQGTWSGATWADSEVPCDFYVNSSGVAAAYTDSALIPSANGSGYGQVDGTKYKLKALRVRGQIRANRTTGSTAEIGPIQVRCLLVEDLMPNGSQAQGEDILQDIGNAGGNLYSFLRIPNGLGKYKIHKDEQWTLQPASSMQDAAATASLAWDGCDFNFVVKFPQGKDVMIKAGNASPTIAGLINCNFFLLLAGVDGTGTAKELFIYAASRAYYVD